MKLGALSCKRRYSVQVLEVSCHTAGAGTKCVVIELVLLRIPSSLSAHCCSSLLLFPLTAAFPIVTSDAHRDVGVASCQAVLAELVALFCLDSVNRDEVVRGTNHDGAVWYSCSTFNKPHELCLVHSAAAAAPALACSITAGAC